MCVIPTCGLNGLRKGDEHPAYPAVEYGTFTYIESYLSVSVFLMILESGFGFL